MDAAIALMLIEALLIVLDIAIYKAIRFISPSLHVNHLVAVDDRLIDSWKDDVSISTVSSPSSHIIVAPPATNYDVFLNFRGDTRDNFTSYLYEALCRANVETFMDHKLNKGDRISPVLLRTIEESKISVMIFSEKYASSTYSMDELVQIMECKDKYKRIAIPIFYNVDPSDVRKQKGSFGDGFSTLKQRFKNNQDKVQKWTKALIQSTDLSGWDSTKIRPESKLIKKIVKDISSKLNHKSSCHIEGLVGIDHHIEKIEELLSKNCVVGIWGMGGAGKTTLAEAVFYKLKAEFEAFAFVKNVREQLARNGLDKLQEECLKKLLKDDEIDIHNMKSTDVKSRLQRKTILLILDDVDDSITIEDLTKVRDWFGKGSRIIITSRDKQVLKNASASTTYHVPELDFHHALYLFSLKAFKQNKPFKSYMELSKWVVDYCQGNPLALRVLGCFFHGRGKEEWESALEVLKQAPHKKVFNMLKLSFDGLDHENFKNVFLDLAFFLNEAWEISLDRTRHLYGSSAYIKISILKERSLISVDENGDIEMHSLVKEMGLEISRQQLISNPEKPIRLCRHEDIYQFFINNKGTEAIRCMSLDMSKIKRITLTTSNFQKMPNAIFLKFYKLDRRKPSKMKLESMDNLPEELMFFLWDEYPLPSVPLNFCAENLVELRMPNSHLQQLWEGYQHFPNLQFIDLSFSKDLIRLPDLSEAPNVKMIIVTGCVKLAQIHSSRVLGLSHLSMIGCKEIQNINIAGKKKESSGLIIVNNRLDLISFSFNKVMVKFFVSNDGNIISGFRFKVVSLSFTEISKYMDNIELKMGTKSLASLLPFVGRVYWSDSPIEFGNFKQHFDYHSRYDTLIINEKKGKVKMITEVITDYEEWRPLKLDEEEELKGEVEYASNRSNSDTLTRAPNNITRWSLLTGLILQKSDIIGNAGCSIPQVSLLKSLAETDCERLRPLIDLKLSLDIPATDSDGRTAFPVVLSLDVGESSDADFVLYVRGETSYYTSGIPVVLFVGGNGCKRRS